MSHGGGPIRIAFCITDLDPGGAERALVQLVIRLDRRRWQPQVFCLSAPGKLVATLTEAGIPVTCLGARRSRDIGVVFRLYRELRKFKPELLQTFLVHANLAGRLAGRWAGIRRSVSGIRVAERRSRVYLWLDRLTTRLVDRNVCVSRAVADFSIREGRLNPNRVLVIPNGVDVPAFADAVPVDLTQFGIPANSRVFVTVGRLDPQKGLRHLIDAADQISRLHADVHFLLVGEGPQRSTVEHWIRERELTDRIHLSGWRPDVASILKASNGLILASVWEGMPNVVLEAMAASLPVVATRVEGVSEVVIEGETGWTVAAGSPVALAEALEKLLADPDRSRAMGRRGQERVSAEFSWDKMAQAYDALYSELTSN